MVGTVKEKGEYYDLITAVMICLGTSDEAVENDVLRLLDVLLSAGTTAKMKKSVLENDFGISMTENMEGEVKYMCNLSDGVEQKGIKKAKVTVIMNMLKENEPIEKICRYAECDESFVEDVKIELMDMK